MCQDAIGICIDRECRKESQLRLFSTWAIIAKSVSTWYTVNHEYRASFIYP